MSGTQFAERMTPLDLLMPRIYIGTVLIFRTTTPTSILLPNLQRSLKTVSEQIPWLSGKVFPVPPAAGDGLALEIRWTTYGSPPHVVDKGSMSATYDGSSREGMPLHAVPAEAWPLSGAADDGLHASGAPVFAASLFSFADGKGAGLCVRANHNVVDGYGLSEIIKLWARNMTSSGQSLPISGPLLKRGSRLTKALGSNINAAASQPLDQLFELHPEYSKLPPTLPTEFASCTSEIFTIPMSKIEMIKEHMRGYTSTPPSTNTVSCALLWSAITRARKQRNGDLENNVSRLAMAVNGRRRLGGDLLVPESPYFGNVVLFSLAEMMARDVADSDSATSLADIFKAVAQSQSASHINSRHIGQVHNLVQRIEDYRAVFPGWDLFGPRDLSISSWADLGLYEADFGNGLGKPEFVRIPYAETDGTLIILPRRRSIHRDSTSEELLEIVVMLRRDDMDTLKKDGLWGDTWP